MMKFLKSSRKENSIEFTFKEKTRSSHSIGIQTKKDKETKEREMTLKDDNKELILERIIENGINAFPAVIEYSNTPTKINDPFFYPQPLHSLHDTITKSLPELKHIFNPSNPNQIKPSNLIIILSHFYNLRS